MGPYQYVFLGCFVRPRIYRLLWLQSALRSPRLAWLLLLRPDSAEHHAPRPRGARALPTIADGTASSRLLLGEARRERRQCVTSRWHGQRAAVAAALVYCEPPRPTRPRRPAMAHSHDSPQLARCLSPHHPISTAHTARSAPNQVVVLCGVCDQVRAFVGGRRGGGVGVGVGAQLGGRARRGDVGGSHVRLHYARALHDLAAPCAGARAAISNEELQSYTLYCALHDQHGTRLY